MIDKYMIALMSILVVGIVGFAVLERGISLFTRGWFASMGRHIFPTDKTELKRSGLQVMVIGIFIFTISLVAFVIWKSLL
jgi:preprotein translocase subunit Sss1